MAEVIASSGAPLPEQSTPELSDQTPGDQTPEPLAKKSLARRIFRWLSIASLLMIIGSTITLTLLYRAVTAPLPVYEQLLTRLEEQRDAGELEQQRQELESQLTALYSDVQQEERWQTVVTADQINSWLATQLQLDFPELEEQGIRDPQILFEPGKATLVMRAEVQGLKTVVSITVTPFVDEEGSLALQFTETHVGNVPLPTATIVTQADKALAKEGGLPGRWTQSEGYPVLLIDFERHAATARQIRKLDTIEIRAGEVYVSGVTEPRTNRVAVRR